MKRFTETSKWSDPWFRKLSPTAKNLWSWLCDNCDAAGVIDPDLELASFQIGYQYPLDTLSDFGDRVLKLKCGKWFIVKFINFQYGDKLSRDCKAHNPVYQSLERHSIDLESIGYGKGINTLQEKVKVKVKDMAMVKACIPDRSEPQTVTDRDASRPTHDVSASVPIQINDHATKITQWFARKPNQILSYAEQTGFYEISKRPDLLEEILELDGFRRKNKNYFPQSLQSLLSQWDATLDRARTHDEREEKNGDPKPKSNALLLKLIAET